MKTNEEKVLKYISGQLTKEELIIFEDELKKTDELKKDYDNIKLQIDDLSIRKELETNEIYFANLLPNFHQRMDKKKKFRKFRSIYYLVPTATAIVVLFLFLLNTKTINDTGYKDLAKEVVNNLSDHEVSDKYLTELETVYEKLNLTTPQKVQK